METNEYMKLTSPVHPFEILEDELKARGLSHKDFAGLIGMQPSNFSRMLKNKGELTSALAIKLESALGISYMEWMKLQEFYLKDLEKNTSATESQIVKNIKNTRSARTAYV